MNLELWHTDDKVRRKVQEQTREINIQKTRLQQVNQELEKFKKVVDSASDYVMILDEEMRVIYMNSSFEKRSGYALDEVV
jgi:PAS domain-containing protein